MKLSELIADLIKSDKLAAAKLKIAVSGHFCTGGLDKLRVTKMKSPYMYDFSNVTLFVAKHDAAELKWDYVFYIWVLVFNSEEQSLVPAGRGLMSNKNRVSSAILGCL